MSEPSVDQETRRLISEFWELRRTCKGAVSRIRLVSEYQLRVGPAVVMVAADNDDPFWDIATQLQSIRQQQRKEATDKQTRGER